MKPPIDIPFSEKRSANEARYGNGADACLLCAKPIKDTTKAKVVVLTSSLGQIADQMTPPEINGGEFFIGPDCWRRNPQLHPYETKTGVASYRDL